MSYCSAAVSVLKHRSIEVSIDDIPDRTNIAQVSSDHSIFDISKYRDTVKYRYRPFTSIAILWYIEYRTRTTYMASYSHQSWRLIWSVLKPSFHSAGNLEYSYSHLSWRLLWPVLKPSFHRAGNLEYNYSHQSWRLTWPVLKPSFHSVGNSEYSYSYQSWRLI